MAASTTGIKAGKAFILIEAVDATGKILNSIRNKMGKFGTELSNIGRTMALRAIAALTPIAFAVKAGASYDDIMRKVEARSEGTAAEMATLREQTLKLGRALGLLPSGLGGIQNIFAQAGFNRAQIAQIAPAVALLARAGGEGKDAFMDMDLAAKAVGAVLRGFDMDASKSTEVVDKLAVALNASNFNLEDITTSLQYAVPAAKFYNVSLEEMLATLGAMRDLQIDASIAGTAFRNLGLYTSDLKAQEKFNALLKESTGNVIQFTDAGKNIHTPMTLMVAMLKATEGLGTGERSNIISHILKARATIPGAAIGRSSERMADMMTRLKDAGGTADRVQKQMDSGLGGAFRRLAADVHVLAIKLSDALGPALLTISEYAATVTQALTKWIEANKGMSGIIIASTAGFLALGATMVVAGQGLIMLSTIFGILLSPVMLLTAAFKSFELVGGRAIITILKSGRLLGTVLLTPFLALGCTLAGVVVPIISQLATALGRSLLVAAIRIIGALRMIPTVLYMGVAVGQSLANIAAVIFTALLSIVGPLAAIALPILVVIAAVSLLYSWLKRFAFNPFDTIRASATAVSTTIKEEFSIALTTVLDWMKKVGAALTEGWSSTIASISNSIASGDLASALTTLITQLGLTWQTFCNEMITAWEDAWRMIGQIQSYSGSGWFDEMISRMAWPDAAWSQAAEDQRQEYLGHLRETHQNTAIEAAREHDAAVAGPRAARESKLDAKRKALEQQIADARARGAIHAIDAHDEALLKESLSRSPDSSAERKRIEDAAAGLIGAGHVLPAVPKSANEAVERTSSEAMKQFMENQFNVYGDKALDVAEESRDLLEEIRDGVAGGGVGVA